MLIGQQIIYIRSIEKLYCDGREARTSEERSGWTANAPEEGRGGICRVRWGFNILGVERDQLEIGSKPIRRPMLDGKVGSKEEEGH